MSNPRFVNNYRYEQQKKFLKTPKLEKNKIKITLSVL
jgi:hypothetical protein